jgi:hypothetical protein
MKAIKMRNYTQTPVESRICKQKADGSGIEKVQSI